MRMGALVLALALVFAAGVVFADSTPTGVDVSAGTGSQYNITPTTPSADVDAGYTYEVNVDSKANTAFWAGVFGNIEQTIVLGSGNKEMYTWPVTTLAGYIYLASSNDVNWAGLDGGVTDTDIKNAGIWSATPTNDTVAATYKYVDDGSANDQDSTAGNQCGTYTTAPNYALTNDGTGAAHWVSCILKDNQATPRIVVKAKIDQDYANGAFDGTTGVDYQAIVPAGSSTTYYFYKG